MTPRSWAGILNSLEVLQTGKVKRAADDGDDAANPAEQRNNGDCAAHDEQDVPGRFD